MPPALKKKFSQIQDLVSNALSECERNKNEAVWPKPHVDQDKLHKEGEALMEQLEKEVQERLWKSEESL
jgi:hypothetical protein